MPRKKLIYTNEHPYHICARSNNKDWFDVPMGYCYSIFTNVMEQTIKDYDIKLHAFVLMSNHFHMLVSTPKSNISQSMRYFMTESSRGIKFKSNRINHMFGARYHWSLINSAEYYWHCYRYVYQNPMRAGITSNIEQYAWSALSNQKRKMHELISQEPLGHSEHIPQNNSCFLSWLNTPIDQELSESTRLALKRSHFEFTACRKNKKLLL